MRWAPVVRVGGRVLGLSAVLVLVATSAARADTQVSSNWSGYAVHRAGVTFHSVSARWRVPTAKCTAGSRSYSAKWVGLGGFSQTSAALEQTGTETDCSRAGHAVSTAWYELVPAPARPIAMTVRPGDVMHASVTATGPQVTFLLQDLTRHRAFRRTFAPPTLDTSSAEWIVEAPSACNSAGACQTLPLANFGQTSFSLARVRTTSGLAGSIASPLWRTTEITLVPQGRRFVVQTAGGPAGAAVPSALTGHGTAFTVRYRASSAALARATDVRRFVP